MFENFAAGSASGILTDAVFYLPIIVSGILVAFAGKQNVTATR